MLFRRRIHVFCFVYFTYSNVGDTTTSLTYPQIRIRVVFQKVVLRSYSFLYPMRILISRIQCLEGTYSHIWNTAQIRSRIQLFRIRSRIQEGYKFGRIHSVLVQVFAQTRHPQRPQLEWPHEKELRFAVAEAAHAASSALLVQIYIESEHAACDMAVHQIVGTRALRAIQRISKGEANGG